MIALFLDQIKTSDSRWQNQQNSEFLSQQCLNCFTVKRLVKFTAFCEVVMLKFIFRTICGVFAILFLIIAWVCYDYLFKYKGSTNITVNGLNFIIPNAYFTLDSDKDGGQQDAFWMVGYLDKNQDGTYGIKPFPYSEPDGITNKKFFDRISIIVRREEFFLNSRHFINWSFDSNNEGRAFGVKTIEELEEKGAWAASWYVRGENSKFTLGDSYDDYISKINDNLSRISCSIKKEHHYTSDCVIIFVLDHQTMVNIRLDRQNFDNIPEIYTSVIAFIDSLKVQRVP